MKNGISTEYVEYLAEDLRVEVEVRVLCQICMRGPPKLGFGVEDERMPGVCNEFRMGNFKVLASLLVDHRRYLI